MTNTREIKNWTRVQLTLQLELRKEDVFLKAKAIGKKNSYSLIYPF